MTKAINVARLLDTIDISALDASAQRSLAQRFNAWASEYKVTPKATKVSAPVKPIVTQKENIVPKVQLDLNDPVMRKVAEIFGLVEAQPTPIATPAPLYVPEHRTPGEQWVRTTSNGYKVPMKVASCGHPVNAARTVAICKSCLRKRSYR